MSILLYLLTYTVCKSLARRRQVFNIWSLHLLRPPYYGLIKRKRTNLLQQIGEPLNLIADFVYGRNFSFFGRYLLFDLHLIFIYRTTAFEFLFVTFTYVRLFIKYFKYTYIYTQVRPFTFSFFFYRHHNHKYVKHDYNLQLIQ